MPNVILFFAMIFAHIIDDYFLQGILASMKQKEWWQNNAPDRMYRFDYLAALLAHSFSWAFVISLPILIMRCSALNTGAYIIVLLANTGIHAFVDDLKANRKTINLITDQSIHIAQILLTWAVLL